MDVILSIVAGLGLRIFLISVTASDPSIGALLGIWEGVTVHQLSVRSRSPQLDHVLAYVLRLAADLIISKNLLRLFMVLLWTAFGALISEAFSPHESLRSSLRRQRERGKQRAKEKQRERERRHRHSRSSPEVLTISSTPLPLRIRTTQQPFTPLISSFPPLTPPSFFLHEASDIGSPSPKPVLIQTPQPLDSPVRDSPPARPRSGLASILDRSPDRDLLPTPPESALSAAPSDGPDVQNSSADLHDTAKTLSPRRLSPIAELSSPDSTPETVNHQNNTELDQNHQLASFSPAEAISFVPPPPFNMVPYSSPPQVGTY
jgi:hypothetical protein